METSMKHNVRFKNGFNKAELIWMSVQGLPSDTNLRSMGLYFIEDETERRHPGSTTGI